MYTVYVYVYVSMFVCIHDSSPLDRLPKNQECHEMWSRKKRKKEAAAAASGVGGVVKEGAGSSNGSGPNPGKPMLSDLSRSRSQSGSPMKEPLQGQRSGSIGPRAEPLLTLANGSLPLKPQAPPPPAPLVAQPHSVLGGPAANIVVQTSNANVVKTYQNLQVIPSQAGGTALPPQLHPHAPIINQQSQLGGEAAGVGGGIAPPSVAMGDGGMQVKQALKTLANPNINPPLMVPLPTVPLSDSILESLHEVGGSGGGPATAGGQVTGGGVMATSLAAQPLPPTHTKDLSNSTAGTAGLAAAAGVGGAASTSQHIQQVIEAQRTQIALLTKLVNDQKRHTNPQQDSNPDSGGMMRGHGSSVPPGVGGYPQRKPSITLRTQTYDYGNRSNKVLENVAVQQLEQDYYHGDPNAKKWSQ